MYAWLFLNYPSSLDNEQRVHTHNGCSGQTMPMPPILYYSAVTIGSGGRNVKERSILVVLPRQKLDFIEQPGHSRKPAYLFAAVFSEILLPSSSTCLSKLQVMRRVPAAN
jgi:hypothetical protein